jgi:hypothetical protein
VKKDSIEVGANKMFSVVSRHETAHKECEAGTNDRYGRMQAKIIGRA